MVFHNKYYYDADGRRVRLWDSETGYVTHVYSGLSVIYESPADTKHIYANGLHIAENTDGTIEYYHQDALGSTRVKTDSSGASIFSDNYKPYGVDYGQSGSEEFKYTGKPVDSSGLYYYGARYYDPETGRFTTADTYTGTLSYPQSLNRYVKKT
jgi:RHS repeat-associated protein